MAKGETAPAAGEQVVCSIFAQGDRVDVIGTSKGKGFQGVMKRHNFAGGAATHGSMFHRAPGGIGASSFPSRVIKGKRFPGPHGRGSRDHPEPRSRAGRRSSRTCFCSTARCPARPAATWSCGRRLRPSRSGSRRKSRRRRARSKTTASSRCGLSDGSRES